MLGHPGGAQHTHRLIALSQLKSGKWLDMGAGDGSSVRMLRQMGFDAIGIDLNPRGQDVLAGNYLHSPFESATFDAILSQCSFYTSGDVSAALCEAARLLRSGGKLVFSDVTEQSAILAEQCQKAGFQLIFTEDMTSLWREYYLEALWTQDDVCLPLGKKFQYVIFVCERM